MSWMPFSSLRPVLKTNEFGADLAFKTEVSTEISE